MRIPIHSWLLLLASATTAAAQTPASASAPHHVDLAITYTADRTNLVPGESFWLQGGSADATVYLSHGFGLAASLTGIHSSSISATAVPLSLLTFTAGPRYTWRMRSTAPVHNLSVFAQFLVGGAHGFNSLFPSTAGTSASASSLALQAGGGLNLSLNRRTSLRLIEADWLRTQLPNGTTSVQNHLLLSTGFLLHF